MISDYLYQQNKRATNQTQLEPKINKTQQPNNKQFNKALIRSNRHH